MNLELWHSVTLLAGASPSACTVARLHVPVRGLSATGLHRTASHCVASHRGGPSVDDNALEAVNCEHFEHRVESRQEGSGSIGRGDGGSPHTYSYPVSTRMYGARYMVRPLDTWRMDHSTEDAVYSARCRQVPFSR